MEKESYFKNAGFPPIKFCMDETPVDGKKERFYQNNVVHNNINIRDLLSDGKKKLIIIPVESESLEIINTLNIN